MMTIKDLFGKTHHPRITSVRLYADEVKPYANPLGQKWMYIGIVAIPDQKHQSALGVLMQARKQTGYHRELHFVGLTNYSYARQYNQKTRLAKKWIKQIMWDREKIFHFYVLGLNLSNLTPQAFGRGGQRLPSIYNRFFRTALSYGLSSYFGKNTVVTGVFHDKGHMDRHAFFDWHSIWRIASREPGIVFLRNRIQFIDSDHRKEAAYPQESHFIQLADVVLGCVTQCLDCTSGKDGCNEVAEDFLPLIKRLTDRKRVRNPFSRYRYRNRCSVSFFPSKRLSLEDLDDPWKLATSHFYISRPLLLQEKVSGQARLL
jgi:hypothetical protein